MQIHEIKRSHKNKTSRQVGRGGKRGKTSGRGHKGQKARAGHKIRPEIRDEMKRQPKLRGRGSNKFTPKKDKPVSVSIDTVSGNFSAGETVSPQTLVEKGVVKRKSGRLPEVKILGTGEIKSKVSVENCALSMTAKEKIEKAGGSIS